MREFMRQNRLIDPTRGQANKQGSERRGPRASSSKSMVAGIGFASHYSWLAIE
jgi:hypothetical protein